MIDDQIKIVHTSQGIKHISTAAVIRHNGMLLFVEQEQARRQLELPVSHVRKGESLEYAVERTVLKVLGLEVMAVSLLTQVEPPVSSCEYGADREEWAIFDVTISENELVASTPTRQIVWLPTEDINVELLTAETEFALRTLGYIRPDNRHGQQ